MESPTRTEAADDATPAMELACNLPALVAQLKALREDMERKSRLYDALLQATDGCEPNLTRHAASSSSLDQSQSGMRGSIFTPFANSQLDPRASQMTLEDLSALDAALDDTRYSNTLTRPSYSMSQMSMGRNTPDKYTVMWVSGECGISLRNFSRKDNKVGAQIAVLQHADGVTTGISNCRLGDQLASINEERVDHLRFREIVEKLKTTRRPISLGFRTNQNVQTSPRAASSPTGSFSSSNGGSRSSHFFSRGSSRAKNKASLSTEDRHSVSGGSHPITNGFFDDDESSDFVHETIDHPGYGDLSNAPVAISRSTSADAVMRSSTGDGTTMVDRSTTTSLQSSTSTLSEDVEMWCREQEEMHSDIIVLLTETVMRCEKLQQENLDQLQNLMQLSASSPSDRSSAASSYVGNERTSKTEHQDVLDVDAVVPAALPSPTSTSPRA
ncbi:hypothetical protein PC129_g12651 [Phytophthora cactorum]|uniref:PDZ domain-containing protein n=1 Tax=Phytophthora cactorum TaxID=29920 RepID=A0A8T1HW69_9STRA|nr:hypothetical protein PC111_g13317 [Phytophthora cactorum]KAG2821445.1 hypothetical protein PC112_g11376 [Phytophthora cactorum]KAG2853783.1 hypothetical protein PC113_g13876 [Phytophthora cactorum]KAG2897553.1 hypothetical protein PC114_g14632 [Phytophthora cactorum]KAG2910793.1 hypothetical protein PC115_g12820 [Phytophthora cactorum]